MLIQGCPADCQKSEAELSWDDFFDRLDQNRSRCAFSLTDVEGEIYHECKNSLERLILIRHHLSRTDALVDKISVSQLGVRFVWNNRIFSLFIIFN